MDSQSLPHLAHAATAGPHPKGREWARLVLATVCSVALSTATALHFGLRELRTSAAATGDMMLLLSQCIGLMSWAGSKRYLLEQMRRRREQVVRIASTDAATGLLNRFGLRGVLDTRLEQGQPQWLVLVGIDGMKAINDLHGHAVGDAVIQRVARRLVRMSKTDITTARTGGDEFCLLLPASLAAPLADWLILLRAAMATPILVQGVSLTPSVSVGAALLDRTPCASEALRMAHVALRSAKRMGPGGRAVFDASKDRDARRVQALQQDLVRAVEAGDIQVRYQPIVDRAGRVVCAEALARWTHPQRGCIPPDVFIPLAEASGCIHPLGLVVLRQVCADLAGLRKGGGGVPRIAVNLSALQLAEPDLVEALCRTTAVAGLSPDDIELELTESAVMREGDQAQQLLECLSSKGFRLAIDDFGTGHSSLGRLQRLPVTKLKIDRAFVRGSHTRCGTVLLETLLTMAGRLGIASVCEGVETPEQFERLKAMGCDLFQGYCFGAPMSIEDLGRRMAASSAPGAESCQNMLDR